MKTIFESPDKGSTVYIRKVGSLERVKIKPMDEKNYINFNEWLSILECSKTNQAAKKLLDQLKIIAYLIK